MEDRLSKFARLVDAGSFTKAAQELHISQPALTAAIAKLERELRASLLVRGPRSLRLTQAGEVAYAAAKNLAVQNANLRSELALLAQQPPALSIGMIDSVANALFESDETISSLEQRAKVSLDVNNSRYLTQAVIHDRLGVAFLAQQPGPKSKLLDIAPIGTEPLLLVCSTDQTASIQHAMRHGQLPRFISYDQDSTTTQLVQHTLRNRGLEPVPSFFSTSPELMLRLVLLQKGVAVLPYLLVKNHIQNGSLSLLQTNKPVIVERYIVRVSRAGQTLSPPLLQISEQLTDLLDRHFADAQQLVGSR